MRPLPKQTCTTITSLSLLGPLGSENRPLFRVGPWRTLSSLPHLQRQGARSWKELTGHVPLPILSAPEGSLGGPRNNCP